VLNTSIPESTAAGDRSVAVIITVSANEHADFLIDALESSRQQTVRATEIVVIDCGLQEGAEGLVAKFPNVVYRRAENADRSAQNCALVGISSRFVVFLNGDDQLTPKAIEAGLECFDKNPNAGLVCGGHRIIDKDGRPASRVFRERINPKRGPPLPGVIAIKAAVMYRTDWLHSVICPENGKGHEGCELHSAERISSHDTCAAKYRYDKPLTLTRSAVGLEKDEEYPQSIDVAGRLDHRLLFHHNAPQMFATAVRNLIRNGWNLESAKMMLRATKMAPVALLRTLISRGAMEIMRHLPRAVGRLFGEALWAPNVGSVCFGDFGRIKPISVHYGSDRGKAVDRYYIERALEDCAELIRGRVLEVGGREYTRSFGAEKIVCSDVLDINPLNPAATIIGDLGVVGALPDSAFDCIVLTQTLQLIYDLDNAIENLYRALAPAGALLITVPGISPIGPEEIRYWYWSFTELSLKTLLSSRFGESNVQMQSYGNVFASICFLTGLSVAEVGAERLDYTDESYPVTVFACARKLR
jgi:hypothetical protein